MAITTPTHGYVSDGSQSVMYSVLSNDSTVTDITTNIYDGDPVKIAAKYGVPFIVISPPMNSSSHMTQLDWNESLIVPITYRTKQESVLRQLHDAIDKAIKNNEKTFEGYGMYDIEIGTPVPDNDVEGDPGQLKTVYGFSRDVFFELQTSRFR